MQIAQSSTRGGKTYLSILSIFNASVSLSELSQYLLKAIFKSQHDATSTVDDKVLFSRDLYLSIDWNCPTIAKNEVLSNETDAMSKIDKGLFEAALLRPDREKFVDIFLSHNLKIHKMLTASHLRCLFKKARNKELFQTICWQLMLR